MYINSMICAVYTIITQLWRPLFYNGNVQQLITRGTVHTKYFFHFCIYSPMSALKIILQISCWTKAFVLWSYFLNLLAKYLLKYSDSSKEECKIVGSLTGVSSLWGSCNNSSVLVSTSPSSIWKSCSLNSSSDKYSSGSSAACWKDSSDISSSGSVFAFFWKIMCRISFFFIIEIAFYFTGIWVRNIFSIFKERQSVKGVPLRWQ